MAQSCYIGLGHTPEELKKAKANLASMKSKNKKAMAPLIDEINAIDPTGLGKLADDVSKDLANDVITPQQYKQTITDLHTKAQSDQAQKAVVTAQADVDALKFQLKKAEELDAKAKANLASQKSKSKKKASDLVDSLQASGYDEEAIELSLSIDAMVNGTITPQELTEHINILKGLPGSTPPAVVVPPASIVPHTPPAQVLPNLTVEPPAIKLTGQQITADINSWSVPDNATFLEYQQQAKRAGALADGLVLDHQYDTAFSNKMFREQMRKSPEYRNWYRVNILKTPAEEVAPFATKDLVTGTWVTDPYMNKPQMMITAVTPIQPISTQYVPDIKLAKKQGSLTQLEKDTLQSYTEVSDTLNSALRAAKGKIAELPAGLAGDVKTLDNLVSKFEFHEDSIVWRGVAGDKYKNKKPGQSWSDHAFASTSYSPESAANFAFEQHGGPTKAGVLLEIHVPKGTRYAPTEVTNPLGDAEVLLERGSKYVVKDSYAIADGRTVVVVDLVRDSSIKHAPAINAKTAIPEPNLIPAPTVAPVPVPASKAAPTPLPAAQASAPATSAPILTQPITPPVPLKTDAWAAAWAKKPSGNTVNAKNFPWAKDEYMKANPSAQYSPYVQDQGAKFPGMDARQQQVVKAAQAKQLKFPLVDVNLQSADFIPTQYGGLSSVVDKYIKNMPDDKFPRAYLWKGQYHLTNGHHRVMAAYIRGDAVLPVQVIDLDQLASADMFPGNLQDLVDGLNPPLASVPSHHLTDAQKAKFGKAPTPAQSAITAPPVGAGPNPASMAPSAPVGGFVIPPQTQQQLNQIQDILNQHPVFKSADDIKKAAKKASSDKFYAKKKVETAINQAVAGKNLQLETDLTKLYDDIVAGKVVTDAKAVMKLIDDVKVNALAVKTAPSVPGGSYVPTAPAAAVPTPPAPTTPPLTTMQQQVAAFNAKMAATAPTPQLVDIYTVDQAIEHAIATTANVGDALKELDTLVPLKELENWGIIKYEELIDAYTNLGYATPPWMLQYPVKIQKGQVSAPNAALAYYNTALPDFQQKVGFSLEDALGVDRSDPIMLKTPTTGYAIPPAAATPPAAGVTATPANLSTPSGADAQVIHAQYTGSNIDVDAGMWMDVMDTQAINTPHFGPGGMLEELTLVGPEVNGTTQIMKEFNNFVMNPNVITPTTLPTSTKFISSELDVHMPDLDKIVASGGLSGEPTKVFIWKGKHHLAGPNTDIIAAKILNIQEVPVEVLNLDEAYSAATKSFPATPATPVPSAPTNDQIMHDINTKVFSGEMTILIKKAKGKPLKKLDINVIGDITLAKEWGLLKFTSMSDLYKNANLPVPQDITDALKLFNTATASMADVEKALVNYPVTFTKVQTDIGLIKGPKKALQPTVLPTHSPPQKTGTLTAVESQQVADLEDYLKKVETIGPGMLDDAYAQLNNAKAGNITIADAYKEAMAVVDAFKLEWQSLHSATYSLVTVGQANYNIPFQLRVKQLRNKMDSQTITLSDAQKVIEQLKIDAGSLTPLAYKTDGALASAKSGAKKKIKEARMAEKDPAKQLVLQKVEDAITYDQIVVYNGSDAKDIIAALDYDGWPTKQLDHNVFLGMPNMPVLIDPNYLPPKSMAEIKAILQGALDAPVSEVIRSTTTMDNIYATLEEWQVKALDNEVQAIQNGHKYVYSQHTNVQTTEWYSLEGQKMDPAISKQIVAGDYAHGDVLAIRDGNKVIIVQGESVVASYIAAGKPTINVKVIELDQIQKLPDTGTVPDYLVHQEQVDDAYKVTGWTNSEIRDAEKWMHGNGQKSYSKDRTITDYAEKDPEFQAALNQAGMSKDEFQAFVSEHISIWNSNSSRGAKMTALHLMVADELQLSPDVFRLTDNFAQQIPAGEAILAQKEGVYRMMVRAMYKHTQDEFAAAGITHLSLWRGYGFQEGRSYMPDDFKKYLIGDKFQYTNQSLPLQSWSTSRSTALGFADKSWGYITKSRVEVKHVFATGITGVGTGTSETEFVLMAAPGTVEHEVYRRPDGLRRP